MTELLDFDAVLAEADGIEEVSSTRPFRFRGTVWEVPSSPVAKDMLRVRRMYMRIGELDVKIATGQLTEADAQKIIDLAGGSELDDLLAMMVGRELVDKWLSHEKPITDDELKKVFRYFWRLYNGKDPNVEEEPAGEAPPPNRGQRRAQTKAKSTRSPSSSKSSGSSKRTSAASTKSRSVKR